MRRSRATRRSGAPAEDRSDLYYKAFAACAFGFALLVTVVYGSAAAEPGHRLRAALAATLAALAAFTAGGFVGFLFGIPKTLAPEPNGKPPGKERSWQANTSLEQISDWLTKILLGIGLTQLTQVPESVQTTGDYIAGAIGPGAAGLVGSTIVVVFSIAGFVIGNLVTRFDLGRAIDREDGVLLQLSKAVAADPSDRRAVEALVITSLYAPPPEGFEQAITAGEAFLARPHGMRGVDTALFHGYLAAGYAQKYAYEQARKSPRDQLELIRGKVIDHVRQAVELSPAEMKPYFQQLANPAAGSGDNDLEVFKNDEDFKRLVS